MDIQTFQAKSKNPETWLAQCRYQRMIGNALMEAHLPRVVDYGKRLRAGTDDEELFRIALAYISSAQMHYGLALEVGMKGLILKKWPGKIEFEFSEDDVRITKIGVHISKGHDLYALANEAGLLAISDIPRWPDALSLKAVLKHLSDIVSWGARYPVPVRLQKRYKYDVKIPSVLYGYHLADVINPLLDFILESPNGYDQDADL